MEDDPKEMSTLLERLNLGGAYAKARYWGGNFLSWLARTKGPVIFVAGILLWTLFWWHLDFWLFWTTIESPPIVAVRRSGLCLQLTSVIVLAIGLGRLQRHFDATPWWRKPLDWLRDFPTRFELPTITADVSLMGRGPSFSADLTALSKDETLEQRVERLENELNQLEEKLDETASDLREEIGSVSDDLEAYKKKQAERMETFEASLERVAIDDLMWEGIALGWLFVGPLMKSEPATVAEWIQLLVAS